MTKGRKVTIRHYGRVGSPHAQTVDPSQVAEVVARVTEKGQVIEAIEANGMVHVPGFGLGPVLSVAFALQVIDPNYQPSLF